jgi:hypothetical protein
MRLRLWKAKPPAKRNPTGEFRRLLTVAEEALGRGDRETARGLLLSAVRLEDKSEHAWTLLSDAMEDMEKRVICLENVLTINPNNSTVRLKLTGLRRQLDQKKRDEVRQPAYHAWSGGRRSETDGRVPFLGEQMVRTFGLDRADLLRALQRQQALADGGRPPLLGQVLIQMGLADRQKVKAALREQSRAYDHNFEE